MIYLIAYSLVCILIVFLAEAGRRQTPERFLVAERKIGGVFGAFAVAASWIWAPALFVSTQVGYKWGYSGLFWFVVPNVLALILFAPVANHVRRRLPNGFSYIQFISEKDGFFRQTQLTVHMLVQVLCCAIQLTAGAELLTFISGAPYLGIIAVMALAPLCYCLISGLVSSILTDCIQYVVIVASISIIYANFPLACNLPSVLSTQTFHPFGSEVLWQFGLASALTLIFGIFSNHQQWQRAFAADYSQVRRTFCLAGFLHGFVTFALGTLGVLLAQSGYVTQHLQIVGAEYIAGHMAPVFSTVFLVMALSGLCATMSSSLCAFGSLVATELTPHQDPIQVSRQAMVALSLVAFLVAVLRVPVIVLWMFCGLFRLGTAAPTIVSVFVEGFSGKRGTIAILLSILAGAPLFVYGVMIDNNVVRTIGMALCLIISASVCLMPRALRSTVRASSPGTSRGSSGSTLSTSPPRAKLLEDEDRRRETMVAGAFDAAHTNAGLTKLD
jgi:urea-proton symporter